MLLASCPFPIWAHIAPKFTSFPYNVGMSETLLQTKLYVPQLRPNRVPRPHLITRLNQGLQNGHKLTLVSAPAGFGKTTLVSAWVSGPRPDAAEESPSGRRIAWLSLDENDSDPVRFLTYFIAGLNRHRGKEGSLGQAALAMLQSQPPPPVETILTALLNELAAAPDRWIYILDDYHLLASSPVDTALAFLIEHLPPQLHLVVAARADPNLPLARLRGRALMTELRANDLRFTPAEATAFLNQVMDLSLSPEEVASLETRTEGWIAGLQLAALSMQGRADASDFIQAFAGDHRIILDYLVEEVLQRQPDPIRSFLLQTSILDRLHGPLCEAVRLGEARPDSLAVGSESGQGMLEVLERANLFVVPLDDNRRWYRYHHLFADVLRAHLMSDHPDLVPALHRRASVWHEQNGHRADAIHHALEAEDFERAAKLIELAYPAMDVDLQSATWLGWTKRLPEALIRTRPVLTVDCAWALLDQGELEVESLLQEAEQRLKEAAQRGRPDSLSPEIAVADDEQFRLLPAAIASARAYRALAAGDVAPAIGYARQALDVFPEENHRWRVGALSLLGGACYAGGDLEAAARYFAEFQAQMRAAGSIPAAISTAFVLAEILTALGRLREVERNLEQALRLAADHGDPAPLGTADLYRALGELALERGDLAAASQFLQKGEKLGEQGELLDWPSRLRLAQARLKEAQGDLPGALELLDQAESRRLPTPLPAVRPIAALKTRLWIRQGRLVEARTWVLEQGLSVDDDLSYRREYEHITLARLLIARYRREGADRFMHEAMALLGRLLKEAEKNGRMASVLEILVLQSLAEGGRGENLRALASLEKALSLAGPEGHVQIFLDEGPPMAHLLEKALSRGLAVDDVHRLLVAFSEQAAAPPAPAIPPLDRVEFVEPLSEREREVLQLLADGLTNQDVADRLVLSLHTVKAHARNIYAKLGVSNRTQAAARGKALGILPPARPPQ